MEKFPLISKKLFREIHLTFALVQNKQHFINRRERNSRGFPPFDYQPFYIFTMLHIFQLNIAVMCLFQTHAYVYYKNPFKI